MKLIDLLSLLHDLYTSWGFHPASILVDLYEFEDDDAHCLWTGVAGNLPAELHDRTVQSFEPNPQGLNIDLI